VYALAAITDMLDGYLARRRGLVSVLGKFLDPLADKLIVAGTLVWLVPMGRIPAWAVVLLISREITITALRSIASTEGLVIAAGDGGKVKTALQMIGIIALILGYPYEIHLGIDFGRVDLIHVGRLLIYLSLVFSIVSAAKYMGLFIDAIDAKNRGLGGATETPIDARAVRGDPPRGAPEPLDGSPGGAEAVRGVDPARPPQ
jgi:CDP-diacylglycerol--glycerol-3-phosphate 3-phosphatidyltransferase